MHFHEDIAVVGQRPETSQPRATPWELHVPRGKPCKGGTNESDAHRSFALSGLGSFFLKTQGVGSPTRRPPLFPSAASALGWLVGAPLVLERHSG